MVFHEDIFQEQVWTNLFVEKGWPFLSFTQWSSEIIATPGVDNTSLQTSFLVWGVKEQWIDV